MLNLLFNLFMRIPLQKKIYYGVIFAITIYLTSIFFSFFLFLFMAIFGFNLIAGIIRRFFPPAKSNLDAKNDDNMVELNPKKW